MAECQTKRRNRRTIAFYLNLMEKHNFKINSSNQTVSLEISREIFPVPVILRTTYHFIDDVEVIVKPGKKNLVIVILIKKDKNTKVSELENLAYEFNVQLVSSFVEEEESKKHVGIRDTMMKAALFSQPKNSSL